jgi:hypothetical protein
MIRLEVIRFDDNGKQTLSNVSIIESGKLVTSFAGMELPWKDNAKQISCIPKGIYKCVKVGASASIPYEHISITSVLNRSGVCIHKANYSRQLKGCLAVGTKHVDIDNDSLLDISNSGKAFNVLMSLVPNEFELEIK